MCECVRNSQQVAHSLLAIFLSPVRESWLIARALLRSVWARSRFRRTLSRVHQYVLTTQLPINRVINDGTDVNTRATPPPSPPSVSAVSAQMKHRFVSFNQFELIQFGWYSKTNNRSCSESDARSHAHNTMASYVFHSGVFWKRHYRKNQFNSVSASAISFFRNSVISFVRRDVVSCLQPRVLRAHKHRRHAPADLSARNTIATQDSLFRNMFADNTLMVPAPLCMCVCVPPE